MSTPVSKDFENHGGSYLLSNNAYEDYVQGHTMIGRPDGQFMTPSNQMDDLLQNHPNNPREWERQLGLNEGSLGEANIHRVDVYSPQNYEPRLPSSDLSGANDKFIGDGKLPGGQDECVINQFPNPEQNPSVGKITNLSQSLDDSRNASGNAQTPPISNIASAYGGGYQAPPQNVDTFKANNVPQNQHNSAPQKSPQTEQVPEKKETKPENKPAAPQENGVNNNTVNSSKTDPAQTSPEKVRGKQIDPQAEGLGKPQSDKVKGKDLADQGEGGVKQGLEKPDGLQTGNTAPKTMEPLKADNPPSTPVKNSGMGM